MAPLGITQPQNWWHSLWKIINNLVSIRRTRTILIHNYRPWPKKDICIFFTDNIYSWWLIYANKIHTKAIIIWTTTPSPHHDRINIWTVIKCELMSSSVGCGSDCVIHKLHSSGNNLDVDGHPENWWPSIQMIGIISNK